ncbi:MAG: SDR family NAD(P)-dependent oxidoreductase [Candidatus Heimdallarchaeota archaeon]
MDSCLRGLHALITGASGGIGSTTARILAAEGTNLTLQYRTQRDRADLLATELEDVKTFVHGADLSDEGSTQQLFKSAEEELGRIDILVANAGVWRENAIPIHKMSIAEWNQTIANDLTSVFLSSREFFLNLKRNPKSYASLVIVGSTAAVFGEAGHLDYATAKAGIVYGMVITLKNEIITLAEHGRVNAVCPGWTRTSMAAGALSESHTLHKVLQTVPLQKIAEPEDIAHIVAFLCSDYLAGHITGEVITVAGGMEGRVLFPIGDNNS